MAKVTIIIGLPGAGKSHLARELKSKSVNEVLLIDDPTLVDLTKLNNVVDIIVTDPHLCNPLIRVNAIAIFEQRGYKVECIFFENNIDKCMKNIAYRNDGRIITREGMKSFNYIIPELAVIMPIWQSDNCF